MLLFYTKAHESNHIETNVMTRIKLVPASHEPVRDEDCILPFVRLSNMRNITHNAAAVKVAQRCLETWVLHHLIPETNKAIKLLHSRYRLTTAIAFRLSKVYDYSYRG